jgi:hypothetical protein
MLPYPAYSHSKQCQLLIGRQPAWLGHEVKVNIINAVTNKNINTIEFSQVAKHPENKKHTQKIFAFPCEKYRALQFSAQFSPSIWQGDDKKTFYSPKTWNVAHQWAAFAGDSNSYLQFKITFPKDFDNVPILIQD